MEFKLGYSTYALKMVDPIEALQLIKDAGYEALEVCLREDWPTSPPYFSFAQQVDLRKAAQNVDPLLFSCKGIEGGTVDIGRDDRCPFAGERNR